MKQTIFSATVRSTWQRGSAAIRFLLVLLILLTGVAIVGNSLRYFNHVDVGFLRTKSDVLDGTAYLPVFYAHITLGFVVLVTGLFSLMMRRHRAWHRRVGKVYVAAVLFVMAPSGLVMGIYANGGWTTQLCFVLLSSLWWYYTFCGYRTIREGQVAAHVAFMHRSYALTLSAVALRLYSFVAVAGWGLQGPTVYEVLVWLSWVPNLLIVEGYLYAIRPTTVLSTRPAARGEAPSVAK